MSGNENLQPAGEDTLSMISGLRAAESENTPAETTTETGAVTTEAKPTETKTAETTTTETTATDDDSEAEARRNALLREIAMDPGLTNQYVQQQYRNQNQASQVNQDPVLPFDEFSFDPANPAHQEALFQAQLEKVGGPLFDKINAIAQRFEQEDQQKQINQIQQISHEANQKAVAFLDTYIPGFSGITEKITKREELTAPEKAVFNEAVNAESAMFHNYAAQIAQQQGVDFNQAYFHVVHNVQLRAQIAQAIGPHVKKYANELGLVSQPSKDPKPTLTKEQQKQMKQEMYVESSNAVPAASVGNFDKAHQAGNDLQMIRALRGM